MKKYKWTGWVMVKVNKNGGQTEVASLTEWNCRHIQASARKKCLGHFKTVRDAKIACERAVKTPK